MKSKAAKDPMITQRLVQDFADLYAGREDKRNPLISPLYGDFTGLPPLLVQVGSDEVLLDDSCGIAEKAGQAGTAVTLEVWPRMFHVFQTFARYIPDGERAVARIGEYIFGHTRVKAKKRSKGDHKLIEEEIS
jgi:acetyl esterase/lipase